MADEVPNLRGGHGTTLAFILALVSPVLAVAGILWKAAQYPTREEFKPVENDVIHLKLDFGVYKAEQKSANEMLNMKLDQLIREQGKGRGR